MLIVLSGLPGTGKSTIAEAIAREHAAPVLSVDPIESSIVSAGVPHGFETGLAAYFVADALADRYLADGLTVVIDAVNAVDAARDGWRRLAAKHGVAMPIIECVVSNECEHRARLASRSRGLAIPEPIWQDVERRRSEWSPWPEPHLTLDAMDSVEDNVARALEHVATPIR